MRHPLLLLAAACMVQACGTGAQSELPPLLEGATAGAGPNALCDPLAGGGAGSTPESASRSPEIQARLDRDHPPGSDEARLIAALTGQGFTIRRCDSDATIGIAEFNGKTAVGRIMWRAGDGRLEWTNGNIALIAP